MAVRRLFGIMLAGLLGAAPLALTAAPAQATEWWLEYSDRSSRLCLEVPFNDPFNNTPLDEATCTQSPSDTFLATLLPDGNISLMVRHSRKCLQLFSPIIPGNELVAQTACDGGILQEWRMPVVKENRNGSVDVMFRNVYTGYCAVGAVSYVPLAPCNSADPRQVWHQHLADGGGNN